MHHIIIGNGPAGVIAAETIRKQRPGDKITMIGDEPEPPYSRMAIPYYLADQIKEDGTYLRKTSDHFRALRIDHVSIGVARIDTNARQVELHNGSKLSYDRLLIATGSHPVRPPIPGIESPNVYSCWTLQDARNIVAHAKPGSRVVQMGAGFIGCIIMEALALRNVKLTVVEMGNRMVPRMMNETAGGMIKDWCEKKGIKVIVNAKVDAIAPASTGLKIKLSNGQLLDADVVISATGVRPNVGLLQGSGIKTNVGVIVDDRMQTNIEGVYAAGDCAEAIEFGTTKHVVNAVQPSAADQARIAAMNMAGKPARSQGSLQINVLDTVGLVSTSFGQWAGVPGGQHVEQVDKGQFKYMRLEFHDDVLIGANTLGHTDFVGAIRGLVQGRVKLGKWKDKLMADPNKVMDAYIACAQPQSAIA